MPIPVLGLQGTTLDDALFFNALENASIHAKKYGQHENYSCLIQHETEVVADGGFMQEPKSRSQKSANTRIFAYAFKDNPANCKINFAPSYFAAPVQFTPEQLHGICLASIGTCAPFSVYNPYSNPDYHDIDLSDKLNTVTVTQIRYVFVPVINLTVYDDLVKKYYQPGLLLYAGDILYDRIDTYTRPYLRPIRRFQLTYSAIQLYVALAAEVSKKFTPHMQKQIEMRLVYQTAFWNTPRLCAQLIEFLNALSISETTDIKSLQSYVHIINNTYSLVRKICNIAVEYMEQMQHNNDWIYEQPLDKNIDSDKHNLPVAIIEIDNTKQKICTAIAQMQQKLNIARNNLNTCYKHEFFEFDQIVLDPPEDPDPILQLLISEMYLMNLEMSLDNACSSANLRKYVLDRINSYVFFDGKTHRTATILNDEQLRQIYKYAAEFAKKDDDESNVLLTLPPYCSNMDQSDFIVPRKSTVGQSVRNRLEQPRSIVFRRTKVGFELWLIPNRKDSIGNLTLPKFPGSYFKVTMAFNLTPLRSTSTVVHASKVMQASSRNTNTEFNLTKDMWPTPRAMCQQYISSSKQRAESVQRINEPWVPLTLFNLMLNPGLYQFYPGIQVLNIKQIKHRLIAQLLDQIYRLHMVLGAIHRDIKPNNILVDFTNDCVRLVDFNLSLYQDPTTTEDALPLSTIYFASPGVVGYHLHMGINSLLYADLVQSTQGIYTVSVYGRELFYDVVQHITKKEEFETMLACTSDDMFSLGVTLFLFISNCYPTRLQTPNAMQFSIFPFMHVDVFAASYPEYRCVLDLLNPNTNDRPNIAQFRETFARLPIPAADQDQHSAANPEHKRYRVG